MSIPTSLPPADLFVLLDKAYRRKARRCGSCGFSLPYRVFRDGSDRADGAWAVIPSEDCSHECRGILEELVGSFQKSHRLSDTGGFRPR